MTGPLLTDAPGHMLPEQVQREVKWVKVAEKWTRISIMTKILDIPSDQREENSAERTNFLMVPGNSGNEGYYEQFGRELMVRLGPKHGDVYFYTVSHLNHVDMPRRLWRTGKNKPSDRFSLADQIQHKKDFCTEYVPKDGRLFVFGHSISCYIALKIIPFLLDNGWNLVKVYALFPAIERLEETPNGARLKPIANFKKNHDCLTKILYSWLKITPFCVKRCIVKCCLRFYGKPPECIIRSGAEVLSINAIRNVAFITMCEMEELAHFDESLLKHKEHIQFYYGTDDSWIVPEVVEDMRRRLPGQVAVDKHGCHHAFVMNDNEIMAKVVVEMVDCESCVVDEKEDPVTTRMGAPFSSFASWLF
ncbi:lipid-droplet associated hydrolase domain-containing protein [Ditylenchus destructor]|nr:lipid-droplet associated hydrolase domain-containing protein [Ditylenchus destructor]